MRIVIAPNSFKHCLTARAAAEAMARGIRSVRPDAVIDIIPLSDGGDGLVDAISARRPGKTVAVQTEDALGRPLRAAWFKHREFALIETALACGLARLKGPEEYSPLTASTHGAGRLVRAALDQGCRRVIIGLGGSATVDGGCGLAAALGYRFLDSRGQPLPRGGGALARLERIVRPEAGWRGASFIALTDVQNPLLGAAGAARMFAPQKGAAPAAVETLERNLAHWAAVVERDLGSAVADVPGGGAAGGMGAGCRAFLDAELVPGAEWVAGQLGLRAAIGRADLVLTGEGRIDRQTALGKAPAHVGRIAKALGKPLIALGGTVAEGTDLAELGISRCVAITPPGVAMADALKKAETNLENAAAQLMMGFRR